MWGMTRGLHSAMCTAVFAMGIGCAEEPRHPVMTVDQVQQGSLLFETAQPGLYEPAPILATEAHIQVTAVVATVDVTQRFHNPADEWIEAVYAFPLPETAAVYRLRMEIGDRVIEGQIHEKAEAKRIYQDAKREGKKASLVEQHRPNIFTTWVANVGPQEDVVVKISYQETVNCEHGRFSLRFPMVVGPRYSPEPLSPPPGAPRGAPAPGSTVPVPVLHPDAGPVNPVRLDIDIDPGVPLSSIDSPSHAITRQPGKGTRHHVELASGTVPADRDFVLDWRPAAANEPTAALFTEEADGFTHVLLMFVPPQPVTGGAVRLSRQVVFVIDASGSMHGNSVDQARRSLLLALEQLEPEDSFNVIRFNNDTTKLFPQCVPASPDRVAEAKDYVSGLNADGGTEMLPAMRAALDDTGEPRDVRQIVFITDGCVTNEEEAFGLIRSRIGDSRLFTVGIGSAPNSYFMRKAAQFGRGTFTYVGSPSEVGEKMGRLLQQLESPVLTDVAVEWDQAAVDSYPDPVPDLYLGQPLVVVARLHGSTGEVRARGRAGDAPWSARISIDGAPRGQAIARLWARARIDALLDTLTDGAAEPDVREKVLEVALQHELVTRYTSLVAVDVTPTAPAGNSDPARPVPLNLPNGWSHEHVFGEMPRTATPAAIDLLVGLLLMLGAAASGFLIRRPIRERIVTGFTSSCAK